MNFSKTFLGACAQALTGIEESDIEAAAKLLASVRARGGRLFLVGSGGGAGHSSHAACDFRKLCNIEAYAPYDNVSELTARVNDDGWETTLVNWLKVSRLNEKDALLVFSVGGGSREKAVSMNLVRALEYARQVSAGIVGVVGRDGGYVKEVGDAVVVIPTVQPHLTTAITEGLQAVVWHLLVTHPLLQLESCKWESMEEGAEEAKRPFESSGGHGESPPGDPSARASRLIDTLSAAANPPGRPDCPVKTKIFADGANLDSILELYKNPLIAGFTTNPTLMRKSGVTNYRDFATELLSRIKDRPVCFEVFADEFDEMEWQAKEIASWGENVYVKIPITNTKRESSAPLIERLARSGTKVNVTAILTSDQVQTAVEAARHGPAAFISVFAGRIADTGVDPLPMMEQALERMRPYPHLELIWASPREILNLAQARQIGCHIITITDDILKKLSLANKDLDDYSLETVKMFYDDARAAGYSITYPAAKRP